MRVCGLFNQCNQHLLKCAKSEVKNKCLCCARWCAAWKFLAYCSSSSSVSSSSLCVCVFHQVRKREVCVRVSVWADTVHLGPAARRVQGLPGRPGGQRLGHVPGDGARRAQELQLPRPVRRQHQFHGGALQSEHWQCGYTDVVAGRSWIREFCQEQRSVRCYFPARR